MTGEGLKRKDEKEKRARREARLVVMGWMKRVYIKPRKESKREGAFCLAKKEGERKMRARRELYSKEERRRKRGEADD